MGSCLSSPSPATTASPAVTSTCSRGLRKRDCNECECCGGGKNLAGGGVQEMREEELGRVPGRMCSNDESAATCLHTQQGRKGTNQDAMVVWENFNLSDTVFCGVFDGHGPYGHFVAKKVRDSLPVKLCAQWKASASEGTRPHQNGIISGSMNSEETGSVVDNEWGESVDVDDNEKLPEMFLPLKQSYFKAFKLMDKELKVHPTIDCFCSGTTAVTLVKQGQHVIVGNIGDSRAILGTRDAANNLTAVQLTVDLKPGLPREAARIQKCNGRVFALQDEPEVARVWLPNTDSPGLAMSRAFGDFCLKSYGLISVPEISYRHLTEKDEFIILATDGIWDVLSNKEVVDIVASAPTRATAARALVDCAIRSWRIKFPTSKIDDCAVVCLFLDHENTSNSVQDCEPKKETSKPCSEAVIPAPSTEADQDKGDANVHTISEVQITEPTLEHSYTLRGINEIVPVNEPRSLADRISTAEEEEWSALEGLTRVNSLLNIPRILSDNTRSTSWRKWL